MIVITKRSDAAVRQHRVNQEIRVPQVRVIGVDGAQLGVMATRDALRVAAEQDLDLVEVAAGSDPPVCRLLNYSKWRYEEEQKARQARRSNGTSVVKEMKFRLKIGPGDYETKTRQVIKFLRDGHPTKVTVMFRGRELSHPELGLELANRILGTVAEFGKPEVPPKITGRDIVMLIRPVRHSPVGS